MPTFSVLYRIRSEEVLKVARVRPGGQLQDFADRDPAVFGVAVDPLIPNEPATQIAYDNAITSAATLEMALAARLDAIPGLEITPVEEVQDVLLRKVRATAKAQYFATPTMESKNQWVAASHAVDQAARVVQDRIRNDRLAEITPQETLDRQTAQATRLATRAAWELTYAVRDLSDPTVVGPLRQLGFAKRYIVATNTLQDATQAEIDSWQAAEDEDEKVLDAKQTVQLLKGHPQFRKFTQVLFKAMNQIREDAGLMKWTKPQIATFIENNVSKDD